MNRVFATVLATFVLSQNSFAAGSTMHTWCESIENPSTLLLKLESPDAQDSCDISYNDDCGKTKVTYTLVADLSQPHLAKALNTPQTVVDSFFEKEEAGLAISTEDFEIKMADGFRNSLQSGLKVPVTIESHVVTRGTGIFQLFCELR